MRFVVDNIFVVVCSDVVRFLIFLVIVFFILGREEVVRVGWRGGEGGRA